VEERVLEHLERAALHRQVEATQVEIDLPALLPGRLAQGAGEGSQHGLRRHQGEVLGRGPHPRGHGLDGARRPGLAPRQVGSLPGEGAEAGREGAPSGPLRTRFGRQRLRAGAQVTGEARQARGPIGGEGLTRQGAGEIVARPGHRLHGLPRHPQEGGAGIGRLRRRLRAGRGRGCGGRRCGGRRCGGRRRIRRGARGRWRRHRRRRRRAAGRIAGPGAGKPEHPAERREGVVGHVRSGPVLEAGHVGLDPVEDEVDGVGGLPVEDARAGAYPLEQRLQAMGDRFHGGEIDGPGGALQAVGAAEHVVPVRRGAAQGTADRRDVFAVLDLEGREQELADVGGQGGGGLSAGIVRPGP
jgi:hypothetical protein